MRRWSALILLAVLSACASSGGGASRATPPGTATVVRPVDGDTVLVDIDGTEEYVRFIGIDTPESVAQDRPKECFGPESKERTAALLPTGTVVRLERDVEARDRYGRLLAYVIRARDGMFVNLVLVEEGYAEARAYPPNLARQDDLDRAEATARSRRTGLWPACGGTDAPLGQ